MPFDNIRFNGYWDANANRVVGKAGPGLLNAAGQEVQLWKVTVAGTTPLGAVTYWGVGDYAFYNGYEWDKLLGEGSLQGAFAPYIPQIVAAVIAAIGGKEF